MIGIQLKGRLGNQMFQYAAARTLAERVGCRLVIAGHTLGRPFGLVGHWLRVDERRSYNGKQQNGLLHRAFGLRPTFVEGRLLEFARPCLRYSIFPRVYSPRRFSPDGEHTYEEFDAEFFDQGSGTWLSGWYQAEGYFRANSERVREWFQPTAADARVIGALAATWPRPPEKMAALHVRRGDYAEVRDALSEGNEGWLLPMSYYRRALSQLPSGLGLAVFSDDPDWAEREFWDWQPWIAHGQSAVVDMFLMAQCRWNIIANSSFSWWAAWLNECPDRIVFAPKHYLGWRLGRWVPGGIEVRGWNYLDAGV